MMRDPVISPLTLRGTPKSARAPASSSPRRYCSGIRIDGSARTSSTQTGRPRSVAWPATPVPAGNVPSPWAPGGRVPPQATDLSDPSGSLRHRRENEPPRRASTPLTMRAPTSASSRLSVRPRAMAARASASRRRCSASPKSRAFLMASAAWAAKSPMSSRSSSVGSAPVGSETLRTPSTSSPSVSGTTYSTVRSWSRYQSLSTKRGSLRTSMMSSGWRVLATTSLRPTPKGMTAGRPAMIPGAWAKRYPPASRSTSRTKHIPSGLTSVTAAVISASTLSRSRTPAMARSTEAKWRCRPSPALGSALA